MIELPENIARRPPSTYLVDKFEYFWKKGEHALACEVVEKNFERLPDPSPLRLAIAKLLIQYERVHEAIEILEKTIEHYVYSGYFFRAIEAYVTLRQIKNEGSHIPKLMWEIYGPESNYVRANRTIPAFPETPHGELYLSNKLEDFEIAGMTKDQTITKLRDIALRRYVLKRSPSFVPVIPIFSDMNCQTYRQFMQHIDVYHFDSTQVINETMGGEIVWCVGSGHYVKDQQNQWIPLSSGTILGLDYYYYVPIQETFSIVSHFGTILRLPSMAMLVMQSSWETLYEDLTRLAFSSVVQRRLSLNPFFTAIPEPERSNVIQELEFQIVPSSEIVGSSNLEGSKNDFATSVFHIIFAGVTSVEVTRDVDDEEQEIIETQIEAPCILGPFEFFMDSSPPMTFRAKTHLLKTELTVGKIQQLIVDFPEVGMQLSNQAYKVLKSY